MEKMEFDHLGIAVDNIEAMLEFLREHMDVLAVDGPLYDENQDAFLCMAALKGGMRIELISGNVVKGFLKKRLFLYHSCFFVHDIEKKAAELVREGYIMVSEPKKAALFHGRKVCFLSGGNLGMLELLEADHEK